MRVPIRLPQHNLSRSVIAACAIALLAAGVMIVWAAIPVLWTPLHMLDVTFYDGFYRSRGIEDQTNGDVVLIAVDQKSLDAIDKQLHYGWPWPRATWAAIIQFVNRHQAKALGIDLVFTQTSAYGRDDDLLMAAAVDKSAVPVVFAAQANGDGSWDRFVLPVKNPIFGAANYDAGEEGVSRAFLPVINGKPSLAVQTLRAAGFIKQADLEKRFILHYYGPHETAAGVRTFRYVSAINVIAASVGEARKKPHALADNGIDPDWFKGKIVLIAATDKGTYDLKSTPVSKISPGTEIQATAIENMIHGQFVEPVGAWWTGGLTLAAAGVAAAGAVFPRKVAIKLLGGAAAVALAVGIPLVLFRGATIRWLPPTEPLLAAGAAVVGGMAWTYLAEDRQRRFVMRALSQSLSPEVAAEIQRDPSKLHIGGERREMTVMFTDIAGFTDLSEKLDPERVAALLNFYLDSMTGILVGAAGTVDKYIGDAIMTFWNAPLTQADHAARACRAAIAMRQRESEIQGELEKRAELPTAGGEPLIYTRIGINSGPMSVGNMGSSFKFSYTVLGDSVNLASRLESINKAYRTKVIISEMTAKLVEGQFLLRPVDVIKVKGKKKPVAIFELLSEAPGTDAQRRLAARYGEAFGRYQAGDWDGAEKILSEILGMFPGDGPSSTLLKRIGEFRSEPPPPDWEGVYAFKEK